MQKYLKKALAPPELVVCLFLAVLAMALYADTLRAGFVADDKGLIVNNEIIHSTDNIPAYFLQAFSTRGLDERSTAYYRPVIATSFALDYALGGGQPWMFHLTNLLMWGICVVLVYLLLRRLLPKKTPAVAGTLIFAAHPVHTETVCWIAGRTDLFALVFMLAAFVCGIEAMTNERKSGWIAGAALGGALAMFSKEIALILLPLWIVYGLTDRRMERGGGKLASWSRLAGIYGILTFGYLLARWYAVGGMKTSAGAPIFDPWTLSGMATIGRCVLEYMGKLLVPLDLSFAFEITPFTSPLSWWAVASLAGGFGLLLVTFYATWRHPRKGFWLWWVGLGLGPALNIIPINEVVAERFLFVPSVGYCSLLGMAFGAVLCRETDTGRLRRGGYAALIVLVVGLGAQTVMRTADWRNERRLYLSALRSDPYKPRAQTLAGEVFLSNPPVPERAYLHYSRALELAADQPGLRYVAQNALGKLSGRLHRPYEALMHYSRALELRPNSPTVRTNRALLLMQLGEEQKMDRMLERARAELEEVREHHPDYADAHFALGYWAMRHGKDPERAMELFDRAATLDDSFAAPLEYKARVLLQQGRRRQALREARRALTIRHSESLVSLIERIKSQLDGTER